MTAAAGSRAGGEGAAPTIHACALAVGEAGVLIRGASGAGKSSLALALLELAAETGRFARLVGDDRIELVESHGRLIARGHPQIRGMIEARGSGILTVPWEPAVVLRLIVDLLPAGELVRFPDPAEAAVEVYSVKLPRLALLADRSSYDCALRVMTCLHQDGTI